MNREQIMEAMNHIDPALIEAADRNTSTAKHSRRGWSRPAIIAACLCMLLAGTALAAEILGWIEVKLPGSDEGVDGMSYQIEAEYGLLPVDILSEEVRQSAAAVPVPEEGKWYGEAWRFDSWPEAEAFLGLELANNSLLEQMEKGSTSFGDLEQEQIAEGPCLAIAEIDNGIPRWIHVEARYLEGQYQITETAGLQFYGPENRRVERSPAKMEITALTGRVIQMEDYAASSGLEASLITRSDLCEAYFIKSGVLFTLSVSDSGPDAQQLLKDILDAYE